ncbi:GFA family protein [Litorimonas sp. RW-G-Af-16]|uniref:GFA family protein n=1 Tax=Litorimonas sp. RW-G-Af-16 TaxID=3241168 RepID=UPI00390CA319
MTQDHDKHSGGCHCGAVSFHFQAPSAQTLLLCNCSICEMAGYQHVNILQKDVQISGQDNLTLYTFGSHQAQHLFCKTCGIKPLYIPRSHPDHYSINLRCVTSGTITITDTVHFDGQHWEANVAKIKDPTS